MLYKLAHAIDVYTDRVFDETPRSERTRTQRVFGRIALAAFNRFFHRFAY